VRSFVRLADQGVAVVEGTQMLNTAPVQPPAEAPVLGAVDIIRR
jgi:hypothetical protein